MTGIRRGYLVVEGCFECGARTSFFSAEAAPPVDEYQDGRHTWVHLGSAQSVSFNLTCELCGREVNLGDMMGLMLSTCRNPQCEVSRIASREGPGSWVYVALCADSSHRAGACVSAEGIAALNAYFNQRLRAPGKKIVVVPCRSCCSVDRCAGIVIADVGLTDFYGGLTPPIRVRPGEDRP